MTSFRRIEANLRAETWVEIIDNYCGFEAAIIADPIAIDRLKDVIAAIDPRR